MKICLLPAVQIDCHARWGYLLQLPGPNLDISSAVWTRLHLSQD